MILGQPEIRQNDIELLAVERRFKFRASGHTLQFGFQRILLQQRPDQLGKIRIVLKMKNVQRLTHLSSGVWLPLEFCANIAGLS